jgi:hypothetical protein
MEVKGLTIAHVKSHLQVIFICPVATAHPCNIRSTGHACMQHMVVQIASCSTFWSASQSSLRPPHVEFIWLHRVLSCDIVLESSIVERECATWACPYIESICNGQLSSSMLKLASRLQVNREKSFKPWASQVVPNYSVESKNRVRSYSTELWFTEHDCFLNAVLNGFKDALQHDDTCTVIGVGRSEALMLKLPMWPWCDVCGCRCIGVWRTTKTDIVVCPSECSSSMNLRLIQKASCLQALYTRCSRALLVCCMISFWIFPTRGTEGTWSCQNTRGSQ